MSSKSKVPKTNAGKATSTEVDATQIRYPSGKKHGSK
jgi:hypothetical protein